VAASQKTTAEAQAETGRAVQAAEGNPGLINALPDLRNLLFMPTSSSSPDATGSTPQSTPQMFGASNAPFTSARVVPAAGVAAERVFPNRINGRLFFTDPAQGDFLCSATVIRRGLILTAGHCVHRGSGGAAGYFTNFIFIPAFRDGVAPFNSWPGTFAIVTSTWATGGGVVPNAADYAIIELAPRPCSGATRLIGNCIGFAGYQTGSFANEHITALGYPCNIDSCRKMHRVDAEPHLAYAPNNLSIGSDMGGGSSGGAWFQNYGEYGTGQPGTASNAGMNRIRAVTSWGFVDPTRKEQGAAILDNRFIQILNTACAHRAGNC
jgi:V8-like Glu-specific endopeptidase